MDVYPVIKDHPLPLHPAAATPPRPEAHAAPPAPGTLAQLAAYCVALAALRPPAAAASVLDDDSFGCLVQEKCACPRHSERGASAGRAALRELHATRFAPLLDGEGGGDEGGGEGGDDGDGGEGLAPLLWRMREEWRAAGLAAASLPPLPAKLEARLYVHAQALRDAAGAVPTRGALVPEMWETEIASLVEDVASSVLGPQRVEAFLAWVASM